MKILIGKNLFDINKQQLLDRISGYTPVCVDVGTGSGRYILKNAVKYANGFYIGVDLVRDNMEEISVKAVKLAKKQRLNNVMFVVSPLETIPYELEGIADIITVNLPWGSLRDGIVRADEFMLSKLRSIGKTGAKLYIIIGYDENRERNEIQNRALPPLSGELFAGLAPAYLEAGMEMVDVSVLDNKSLGLIETDWAKRLAFGISRQTYKLSIIYN